MRTVARVVWQQVYGIVPALRQAQREKESRKLDRTVESILVGKKPSAEEIAAFDAELEQDIAMDSLDSLASVDREAYNQTHDRVAEIMATEIACREVEAAAEAKLRSSVPEVPKEEMEVYMQALDEYAEKALSGEKLEAYRAARRKDRGEPEPEPQPEETIYVCPACNIRVAAEATGCLGCGSVFEEEIVKPEPRPPQQSGTDNLLSRIREGAIASGRAVPGGK